MLKVVVKNELGEQLRISQNEDKFKLVNIDGLDPPKTTIYSSNVYTLQGEIYNYSKDEKRNIVINLYLVNDIENDKVLLFNAFKKTKKISLIFDDFFTIDGYVETLSYNQFSDKIACQISVMCLYPYFSSINQYSYNFVGLEKLFEFEHYFTSNGEELGRFIRGETIEINNYGIDTGCRFEITFNTNCKNIEFLNSANDGKVVINREFYQGDELVVDLTTINKIFTLNGNNIISNLVPSEKLFYLSNGVNYVTCKVKEGLNYNNINIYYNYQFAFINENVLEVIQ